MRAAVICAAALTLGACAVCSADDIAAAWKTDLANQALSRRPRIEARYTSAARESFEIDAEQYRVVIDLRPPSGQRVSSFAIKAPGRRVSEALAGRGFYLRLTTADGRDFTTLNAAAPSRVNIYRRGPYYIETHWLDVAFVDGEGNEAPVKGEVVFYSYPEKTHVSVILHVTGSIEVLEACAVLEFDAQTCATRAGPDHNGEMRLNDFCLMRRAGGAPTAALIYPVPHGVGEVALEKTDSGVRLTNYIYGADADGGSPDVWNEGERHAAHFQIQPLPSGDISPTMEAEIDPLLSSGLRATKGMALGYDPIRGCYKVQTDNPGGFSYHYREHQNDYEIAEFSIRNNAAPRKVYILHETRRNPGSVECGVVLDDRGIKLPITVQISKNFAGEKEEPFYNPNDTPFSETFFPLYLGPGEERTLSSLHLYQNWGSHPLKQFSSLGAWMDYYHMSTGVTETTCYVPFLFGGLDGVHIADLRPMSQQMWESQPQHDNVAGHSFMRYRDDAGVWHFIEYVGTTFRSTGPNWADVRLEYVSDDGKAKVTLDVFELPQTDELRNFVRMRVDFVKSIAVKDGDFARNLRLLNIASWVQRLRYTTAAYGGPADDPVVTPIRLHDGFTLAGAPLPSENGFATIYPDKRGANAFVVRRFDGRLDGRGVAPGVSVIGQKNGDTILMLVPITEARKIEPGDYLEIDLFLMPYGGGTQNYAPAQKAAFDYGANAPRVTDVIRGTKLADFPTRILLDENGGAEFSVAGGINYIPIIVEGAADYTCQRLYRLIDGRKTLIDLAQEGERDGYQVFVTEDGGFGWVFLVMTDGAEYRYVVE